MERGGSTVFVEKRTRDEMNPLMLSFQRVYVQRAGPGLPNNKTFRMLGHRHVRFLHLLQSTTDA